MLVTLKFLLYIYIYIGITSEQQTAEEMDLNGVFMEFHEHRAEHPGSMSDNGLKVCGECEERSRQL